MPSFYVYAYLRSKDSKNGLAGSPYYIGKGKGRRALVSQGHTSPPPADKNNIVILAENMSEIDAFQAEMLLIQLHGRIDQGTGCLRNRTDGGEGTSGRPLSDETRRKIAITRISKGIKNWNVGKSWSEETRRKIGESRIGKHYPKASANHRANNSVESNLKRSATMKGNPALKTGAGHGQFQQKLPASGYRGVYAIGDKWFALVTHQGKRHYCGTFTSRDEAAQAYNLKAIELYGDQAILNNIELRKAA